jgi:hypothetical protein
MNSSADDDFCAYCLAFWQIPTGFAHPTYLIGSDPAGPYSLQIRRQATAIPNIRRNQLQPINQLAI